MTSLAARTRALESQQRGPANRYSQAGDNPIQVTKHQLPENAQGFRATVSSQAGVAAALLGSNMKSHTKLCLEAETGNPHTVCVCVRVCACVQCAHCSSCSTVQAVKQYNA